MVRRGLFLTLFAVSGAAALIYEVVWTRLLTLQMGHGIAAASTVLAAFMGGLAIGSAIAGRRGGSLEPRAALRLYGSLELAIGFMALLLPFGIAATRPLLATAYAEGQGGAWFALLRLGSSVLLLAAPAAAMGATFPIASRWVVRDAAHASQDAGRLYAANTLGAAIGAVLAGFVLIPMLGLQGSTWIGATLNAIAAGGALTIAKNSTGAWDLGLEARGHEKQKPNRREPHIWIAALALGVSGFASLTLQVVWTRLLALILGPTTYAFSLIVAIFIIGIAIGAAIGARLSARVKQPAIGLAFCLIASVGLALAAATAVDWAMLVMADVVSRPEFQFSDVLGREVLLVTGLLLPATIAFGAAFPFAVAVATGRDATTLHDTVTGDLGLIYAINTLGAILGALLSGFVFIPAIGLHTTIRLVGGLGALSAAGILMATAGTRARTIALAASAAVLALAIFLPPWDRLLLSSGAYKYAPAMRGPGLQTALTAGELLSYREGATGTVAVRRLAGTISLAIDGKVDASNAGDMLTQRLLAHVPMLLHPNPQHVAVLGLGSGVTLGSALTHTPKDAVVLEISPEVVEASRFFDDENHHALANPRTKLIVGDGRTHLLMSKDRYDVIVSEPSNPWMAGIASLFTEEFFTAARDHLAPGGVLCQWAHTYDISSDDLKSIVRTFLSVFPNGSLWLVGDADVLLVASDTPIAARISGLTAAWQRPGVAEDLASVSVTNPFSVVSLFIAEGAPLAAWAANADLQTDNRAQLEFSGPRSVFGPARDDNATALRELARQAPVPPPVAQFVSAATAKDWQLRGSMFLAADAVRPAFDDFVRALEANPSDGVALDGLIRSAANLNRIPDARTILTRLASDPSHQAARLALSRLLASQGNTEEAIRIPFGILQDETSNLPALIQLASVLSDVGDRERLAPVVNRLMNQAPYDAWSNYYAASLAFMQNRPDLALPAARKAVSIDPSNAKAHNLIGACLATMGQRDEARKAFQASLAADAKDPGTYNNLATLELESGNRARAIQYFSEALTIEPANQTAREGLTNALGHPIR